MGVTAEELVHLLRDRGRTIAAAESLTAGLFLATLASVPGASAVVRGGVVVYATDLKATLGGLDPDLLARVGPVSREAAQGLAESVRTTTGADLGVALTGVAGPDRQDGHPVGTVFLGLAGSGPTVVRALMLSGDRQRIRTDSVSAAVALVATTLRGVVA